MRLAVRLSLWIVLIFALGVARMAPFDRFVGETFAATTQPDLSADAKREEEQQKQEKALSGQTEKAENTKYLKDGSTIVDSETYKFRVNASNQVTVTVIGFGVVVLLMIAVVGWKTSGDQALRSMIVVLIVISSLILIVAGFSNEQIAPAFGLFGTIVGYMLGRLNHPSGAGGDESSKGAVVKPGA